MDYLTLAKKFNAKKSLGQNFLIDPSILNLIKNATNLNTNEDILEIGPGLGFLTSILAHNVRNLYAVEIDPKAIEFLNTLQISNLHIIQDDILNINLNNIFDNRIKIFANLPYYITTPILIHLLGDLDKDQYQNRNVINEIILMVQKEVGRRITANNNSKGKEWGSLSILINYWAVAEYVADVSPKSFWPIPKVESCIIKLKIREKPLVNVLDSKTFKKVVRSCFLFRRKNIKNALLNADFKLDAIMEALKLTEIKENIRGETLSIFQLAKLSDHLFQLSGGIS